MKYLHSILFILIFFFCNSQNIKVFNMQHQEISNDTLFVSGLDIDTEVKDRFYVKNNNPYSIDALVDWNISNSISGMGYYFCTNLVCLDMSINQNNILLNNIPSSSADTIVYIGCEPQNLFGISIFDLKFYDDLNNNDSVNLTVVFNIQGAPPTINSQTTNLNSCENTNDTMFVQSNGSSPLLYQWYKNGIILNGEVDSILTFNSLSNINQGNYYCIVSNSFGSDTTNLTGVIINPNPTNNLISTNGLQFCEGNNINLETEYNSNYQYDWFLNGLPIIGISNENEVSIEGLYSVKITDNTTLCNTLSNTLSITKNESNFNLEFTADNQVLNNSPFNLAFNNETSNISDYEFIWNFGNGISEVNNSTTVFYTYPNSGIYSIFLKATNTSTGCIDSLFKQDYINCNTNVGINNVNEHIQNLFYDFSNQELILLSNQKITDCQIVNLNGQNIMSFKIEKGINNFDLSMLKNSIYFLTINEYSYKFVKK